MAMLVLCLLGLQAFLAFAALDPRGQFSTEDLATVRYSNDWAVQLDGMAETAINILASSYGFINMGQIGNLEGYYHFQLNVSHENHADRVLNHLASRSIGTLAEINDSPDLSTTLEQHDGVGYVKQQILLRRVTNDLYTQPTDPNWSSQWSLLNNEQSITNGPPGKDLNVEPAWMQGITGSGIVVAIVDTGVERRHRDLTANYDSFASYDYINYDDDPTPDNDPEYAHGTECAGVVGMAKSNNYCGVGVAHKASIGGIRFNVSWSSDLTHSQMLSHKEGYIDVYSNSWGPLGNGFTVGGPDYLTESTFETGANQGRGGKGSIFVWASGNGGEYHDSCAADGYVASIYTIAIGSADQTGGQAAYDENCPGKMAVTFSLNAPTWPTVGDPWTAYNQVSTTTLNGECTDSFTGTSSATPMVSAVIALALEANPDLTWRDVQYLIAYTSNRDRLVDGDWITNGGGLSVSPKFGFGAIDAEALVTRARRWINVPTQQSDLIYPSSSHGNDYGVITATFDVTGSSVNFLEHVVVTMSLSLSNYGTEYSYSDYQYQMEYDPDNIYNWLRDPHPKRGDIQITLTSPQGTTSTLLPYRLFDFINVEGYTDWPFMSVLHWSENPSGRWTLTITYKSSYGTITMNGLIMTLYGTASTPQAVSNIPSQCDSECLGGCSGPGPDNCDICRDLRVSNTQKCVLTCPEGSTPYKSYCLSEDDDISIFIIAGAAGGGGLLLLIFLVVVVACVVTCSRRKKADRTQGYQLVRPTSV